MVFSFVSLSWLISVHNFIVEHGGNWKYLVPPFLFITIGSLNSIFGLNYAPSNISHYYWNFRFMRWLQKRICYWYIYTWLLSLVWPQICRWHHPYGRKWRGTKKPLDESESGEWKSWLKAQHSEYEDHGIWPHHFMGNRWGNSGNSVRLYFWAPKSL